ncbi:hypothetical protein Tco_1419957 [Tanacetum coccineum]
MNYHSIKATPLAQIRPWLVGLVGGGRAPASHPIGSVAFDLLRDALSAIFGLSELKVRTVTTGKRTINLALGFLFLLQYLHQIPSPPLPQIPSPPLPVSSSLPVLSPSPPASPIRPLGYQAAMIQLRAKATSTSHSLLLPLPIILSHTRLDVPLSGTPPLHFTLSEP